VQQTRTGVACLLVAAVCLGAALVGAGATKVQAQEDQGSGASREYAIKAAYLYQFSRYVQWPAEAIGGGETPFVIGVVGSDPFGEVLDEIARTKKVEGRPIVVRRLASAADYGPCHIVFVPSSATAAEREAAIRKAHGAPVLLVGEDSGFAQRGGTVNFLVEDNKVRFEINVDAAKQQRLKISSKLLSLAKIVGGP